MIYIGVSYFKFGEWSAVMASRWLRVCDNITDMAKSPVPCAQENAVLPKWIRYSANSGDPDESMKHELGISLKILSIDIITARNFVAAR